MNQELWGKSLICDIFEEVNKLLLRKTQLVKMQGDSQMRQSVFLPSDNPPLPQASSISQRPNQHGGRLPMVLGPIC